MRHRIYEAGQGSPIRCFRPLSLYSIIIQQQMPLRLKSMQHYDDQCVADSG